MLLLLLERRRRSSKAAAAVAWLTVPGLRRRRGAVWLLLLGSERAHVVLLLLLGKRSLLLVLVRGRRAPLRGKQGGQCGAFESCTAYTHMAAAAARVAAEEEMAAAAGCHKTADILAADSLADHIAVAAGKVRPGHTSPSLEVRALARQHPPTPQLSPAAFPLCECVSCYWPPH